MNCPKYVAAAIVNQGCVRDIDVSCDKEKCARWDARHEQCIDISLTEAVEALGELLIGIIAKMSHDV